MTSEEIAPPAVALARALVAAQKAGQAVGKSLKHEHHGYSYASTEAIIEEARGALAAHGLAFAPTSYRVRYETEPRPPTLLCEYELMHELGETRRYDSETPIIEGKGRPLDKAVATAKTYDLGYQLRGLLLLPRVEEGAEPDRRDDREHEPHARARSSEDRPAENRAPRADVSREEHRKALETIRRAVKVLGEDRAREIVNGRAVKGDPATAVTVAAELEAAMEEGESGAWTVAGFWALAIRAGLSEDEARADLRDTLKQSEPEQLTAIELAQACQRLERLAADVPF